MCITEYFLPIKVNLANFYRYCVGFLIVLFVAVGVFSIAYNQFISASLRHNFQKHNFIFGANGHPLSQRAYTELSLIEQMNMLTGMHMSYYRFDAGTNAEGLLKEESRFSELTEIASRYNIKLLPVLWLRGLDSARSEEVAFEKGYIEGSGFGKRYGKFFEHYEMGNEQDLKVLKERLKPGKDIGDYRENQVKILAAFLRGMDKGLKETDAESKTIVDMAEGHYGFFKLLKKYSVNFDIIGIHWYSKVPFTFSTLPDIVAQTSAIFDDTKPVWITEFNSQFGSYGDREDVQDRIVSQFVEQCKFLPKVEALFIYELLDEPRLNHPKETEKTFGLIKWIEPHTKWEYKKAGKSLQKFNSR